MTYKDLYDLPDITLDFSNGAYVYFEDLAIWIAHQQSLITPKDIDPLQAHSVAVSLLEEIKKTGAKNISSNGDYIKVDERLKTFLFGRFNVQLPEATAPVSRENPNKEFIREAVDFYLKKNGELPGSLNILMAFAKEYGVIGYVDIFDSGGVKRDRKVSFTDSQRRIVNFSTLENILKARLSAIKHH